MRSWFRLSRCWILGRSADQISQTRVICRSPRGPECGLYCCKLPPQISQKYSQNRAPDWTSSRCRNGRWQRQFSEGLLWRWYVDEKVILTLIHVFRRVTMNKAPTTPSLKVSNQLSARCAILLRSSVIWYSRRTCLTWIHTSLKDGPSNYGHALKEEDGILLSTEVPASNSIIVGDLSDKRE